MVKAINRMKEELFEEVKDAPYELPEGWKWVRLEKLLLKKPQYGYTASATKTNTGVKFLRITDIQNNTVEWSKVPYVEIGNDNLDKFKLNIDDFVFARTGSTTGKTYRVKSLPKETVIFASYLIRIIPNQLYVFPRFLEYFFFSTYYWQQIITKGAAKPNFNAQKLRNLLIPLPFKDGKPDLEKQKQIVEKIEVLFKEIDKAIELRQKAIEETERLFDRVLDRIFREAEKDKENWKWVMVSDFYTEIVRGVSFKKKEISESKSNNAVAILRANNITENGFNLKSLIYIDKRKVKERQLLKKGDIVYTTSSGSKHLVGKSAIVRKDLANFSVGAFLSILRFKREVLPEYFIYVFQSRLFRKHLDSRTVGMNINNIKKEDVLSFCFPIPLSNGKPDLRQQKEVAKYLDNLNNKIKQLEELQRIQLEKFRQLKESILSKAFRGN